MTTTTKKNEEIIRSYASELKRTGMITVVRKDAKWIRHNLELELKGYAIVSVIPKNRYHSPLAERRAYIRSKAENRKHGISNRRDSVVSILSPIEVELSDNDAKRNLVVLRLVSKPEPLNSPQPEETGYPVNTSQQPDGTKPTEDEMKKYIQELIGLIKNDAANMVKGIDDFSDFSRDISTWAKDFQRNSAQR